ncbi:class I SAM-dependent methyltransferase [Novipirellula caenicola]|uniref:Methyltransferase domain-containing protein n=1 Tax=Novipirellula caenicola TaxID=1536901 RepID=A0ABP9W3D3_9BACT
MKQQEAERFFDRDCASGYDQMQTRLAPLRDALHLLMEAMLSDMPSVCRVLCVGAGTGWELIRLAERHPQWTFTAVEPSAPMLEVCQRKAEEHGIRSRCVFHGGYLDSLPSTEPFDVATSLLVSQFILDREDRADFFREIGERLRIGGRLVNADLAADTDSPEYERLLEIWWHVMRTADVPSDGVERMKAAYGRDVAVLPPDEVKRLMVSGGFESPVKFLQTGLIHAWFTRRTTQDPSKRSSNN